MAEINLFWRCKRLSSLLLFLLCISSVLPAWGQSGAPSQNDFTTTLVQPNKDCGTPGVFSIRYNPNVLDVDKVEYSFGSASSGPWFQEVVADLPTSPVKIELPTSSYDKGLYIRVKVYRNGGFSTIAWMAAQVAPKKAAEVELKLATTPAGNGTSGSGSVRAWLEGPNGYTDAVFKLYRKEYPNTVLNTQRSKRPYDGVLFVGLVRGEYVVKAEAKPACVPATPGDGWDTDHYNLSADAEVSTFNLIGSAFAARGTCLGGIKAEVSKLLGVERVEYTVARESAPNTPIQTFMAEYPNFTHVFTGLAAGAYVLKARELTGNSIKTVSLRVNNQEDGVSARVLHGTLPGVNEGAVNIELPNTSLACPAKLTITRTDAAFTPIVKNDVVDPITLIEGLPKGSYQVKAEYGGVTKTYTFYISEGTLGYFSALGSVQPDNFCEPTGGYTFNLYNGLYYAPMKIRVTDRSSKAVVREFMLPAGETRVELSGMYPGEYTITGINESANLEISAGFTISQKKSAYLYQLSFNTSSSVTDLCSGKRRIPVNYTGSGGLEKDPAMKEFLDGATFELYDGNGVFQYAGAMPKLTGNEAGYIEIPASLLTYYTFRVKARCGYPKQDFNYYTSAAYKFSPVIEYRGCGMESFNVNLRVLDAKGEALPLLTYRLTDKATGALVGEYAMREGLKTAIFAGLKPGDYKVEWWPQCDPTQIHTEDLQIVRRIIESSRSITAASCGSNGYFYVYFNTFKNINSWRHELIRKSDNQLVRVYSSSGETSQVYFGNVPPGEYIVKSTPIVQCGDIQPGVFDVTVPTAEFKPSTIYPYSVYKEPTPFQNDGVRSYYSNSGLEYVKWRVRDVVTGAEINKGEVKREKTATGGFYINVDKLPRTYKIQFETPCGMIERLDSFNISGPRSMPAFDIVLGKGNTTCNTKPTITVNSKLTAAGFPNNPSKIILYKFMTKDGVADFFPVDSVTNLTSIIDSHTFKKDIEAGSNYAVGYFYGGMSDRKRYIRPEAVSSISLSLSATDFSLKGKSILTAQLTPAEPGTKMRLVVTGNNGVELSNEEVPADVPYRLEVSKPHTSFTAKATVVDGCLAGKTVNATISPTQGTKFNFSLSKNGMKCKNDGEITMVVPESFRDVDQISYTLTKTSGTAYTNVAETSTPKVPKTFYGLEAGTYKVIGRATVFKDENNQPVVQDFEQNITLTTPYGDGLYATVRPDYMVPTTTACANGRIGLNIEKGSGKYRVFLKATPDGTLAEKQEIFTDPYGAEGYNKLWGEGLKPGHYALTVTDGCMEREIPDAEILEMPNTPNISMVYSYLELDYRTLGGARETRDSLSAYLTFDPSLFSQGFRSTAYRNYEIQVVGRNQEPDNNQWKKWPTSSDGRPSMRFYFKRFANCDGVDVLLRFKNCPSSVTRHPFNMPINQAFSGRWELLKCNTVQWVFTNGEVGQRYKIKVTRLEDNRVLVDKEVTYSSREEYLTRDPQLEFPADKSYRITMTPLDYCGDALYSSTTTFQAINRRLRYTLDYGQNIWSDCDGRLLAIQAWTDCRQPMKYYAYEVVGTEEKLVDQSGNYVPEVWYSAYKFMRDKTYVIRVVEAGQPEDQPVQLVKFTLNYRLPKKYYTSQTYSFMGRTFCGNGYSEEKKGYDLNSYDVDLYPDWSGVPPVDQDTYLTLPKMTMLATQKEAPHRKFRSTYVRRSSSSYLDPLSWKEVLPDGTTTASAYAPEGNYSMVAETACGDVPLADEYIGRPVLDLSPTTVVSGCDGKFTVTPKGIITYQGRSDNVEITSFYVEGDAYNTTRNWGQSFDTYQREFTLIVNIKRKSDNQTCTLRWPFSMSRYALDFDQSESVSLFCSGSNKGLIHMALKGGQPPYTYKLTTLSGTEIETRTENGAVDFLQGTLGQRYRIEATDACGLSWIKQDVVLQDPAVVSSTMVELKSYCAGDHVKMAARFFPGATYLWHLPDGSTHEGREIEFDAQTDKAGLYKVDIKLTTCTVTLYARITVRIVDIQEVQGLTAKQVCVNEPVEFALDAASATINGTPVDEDEVEYRWESTTTLEDADSWKTITGAEEPSLTFTAPAPGVYYVRRTTTIDECSATSGLSKLTVSPGINVAMTPTEKTVTIKNKDPFTLTAGVVVSGDPKRTYTWQRSGNKKDWTDVGTGETFTETEHFGSVVYYRRIVNAGSCRYEGETITVRFKKRWPAYINPQLRQRTLMH